MKKLLVTWYRDSLFRNSFYLMLSTAVSSGLGFVFWIICSHLFSPSDVGLTTSIISVVSLLSTFSLLGLDNTIIRFLASSSRKNEWLSTVFITAGAASLVASGIFLLWAIAVKSPLIANPFERYWVGIVIVYLCMVTLNNLLDSTFIAYRAAAYVAAKNALFGLLKIILPLILLGAGVFAIMGSILIALTATVGFGFALLLIKFDFAPVGKIDIRMLRSASSFAMGNYVGNIFGSMPTTLVPLIILVRLGASSAAFFYMPLTIVALLNIIPSATAQSLFAEVSHDERQFLDHARASVRRLFWLLLPAALASMIAGPFVLVFFGSDYAQQGTLPLEFLIIASVIGALNYLGDALLNIKKLPRLYIGMNALNALMIVLFTYLAAPYGLAAVALSMIAGQLITLGVYASIARTVLKPYFSSARASD